MSTLVEHEVESEVRFPGRPVAMDGTQAVVEMETAASEAAGAYPITPSTQMGEGWALAAAQGKKNVNGRRLLFFEPEGEHAAAGVTAGMSMVGLRSTNFSSGQGIAYMHESLYAAVGKRLTYVLNMACRAMTKHALNVHAGHDDYHAVDDTGFFQLFAKNAQEGADLNLISHRIAELALTPGICAQDGFLTSHVLETFRLPERELVREFLGDPSDLIESPTPAQRMLFGPERRRIPELFDYDNPTMLGVVQNQDSYAQGVASQRPFFFDHVAALADRAFDEYAALTGRRYARALGYRLEDAEYVLAGQGSVVWNAEATVDHLRAQGVKIGVLNLTMFRPFPADVVAGLLKGKKAVTVLERVDQPLAVDPPLLREIRAALGQAVENHREETAGRAPAHPGVPAVAPDEVPTFLSGCFGLGSRDLQPGDLLAAAGNMTDSPGGRRRFYLGIEFVREGVVSAELAKWQEQVVQNYPEVKDLALPPRKNVNLLPEGSVALRIHSVGGWGAITMGKNLTMTLFDLLGMQVKSNPKYGSEKKGQPTTFYGVFAHQPVRVNCELRHVDVVLSPDPNVFRHSNPLDGLREQGTFVIQADGDKDVAAVWASFPGWAQRIILERHIQVYLLDGFAIAKDETDEPDLQFRMQGAAFQGAFFRTSDVMERESLDRDRLFGSIRTQLEKKFGHRGATVVEDNFRVISRGFEEARPLDAASLPTSPEDETRRTLSRAPWYYGENEHADGLADPTDFLNRVCHLYSQGEEPIADPFAAYSAIPAATGIFRDMTGIRFEVPEFVADHCTGCGQCWTQCPDAAIPGLVSDVDDLIRAALNDGNGTNGAPSSRMSSLVAPLAEESRRLLREGTFLSFAATLSRAYATVGGTVDPAEKPAVDAEFDRLVARAAELPVARTAPFFTVPERREEGSGGLLSVTVNPFACKGCNLCVEVCPDDALRTVKQTDDVVDRLRRNWKLWERLPDTPDRFLQVSDMEHGVGVLHTLLLKKKNFLSMVGGDGSCMGCGEKTGMHLVTAAIEAAMQERVKPFVEKLDSLVDRLDHAARELLVGDTDLETIAATGAAHLDVEVSGNDRERLERMAKVLSDLRDLRWRYEAGPTGRGRAALGITNATGCSSVWGSTYPYNPYPYPWANHLFQDAPSVAVGIFEGLMRKMADGFTAVRKAELELEGAYEPSIHDPYFEAFDWHEFTDEEFHLCPPVLAVGGDGAMLDIGFQNVSRLLASGKPIRVVVLDTQVYSNTGGQACTSGFHGQISDMAAYGAARHGKEEQRKEMGLIAMAHRNAFVLQTSQAHPAHLLAGVLRGLNSRRPAVFNIYSPCQAEHGLPDSGSANASRLALESRAFPYFVYDPDKGATLADRLDLEGNPEPEGVWPTYSLEYVDDDGVERTLTLPLTIADWAVTEPRFGRHFRRIPRESWNEHQIPFHEYLSLAPADRPGHMPYVLLLDGDRRLKRMSVSDEMTDLAEDRLQHWEELQEMAGLRVPDRPAKRIRRQVEKELDAKLRALGAEYEAKIEELKRTYPVAITRRIAEALVAGRETPTSGGFPAAPAATALAEPPAPVLSSPAAAATAEPAAAPAAEPEPAPAAGGSDPWIDTELCTSCNECIQINPRMFQYDDDKKAFIADPKAGTFAELVKAAERCTARIIHPGTPLDPDEPDLEEWTRRAEPFN